MKLLSIGPNWSYLHRAMALLGLALLVAVACWGGITTFSQHLAHEQQLVQQQLSNLQAKIQPYQSPRPAARDPSADLSTLTQSDLLAHQENRLVWLQALMQIQHNHADLSFHIGAQQLLAEKAYRDNSALQLTPLKLQFNVRHEAHFSSLHHQFLSLPDNPRPLRCDLQRAINGLDVACEYGWIVLSQSRPQPKAE